MGDRSVSGAQPNTQSKSMFSMPRTTTRKARRQQQLLAEEEARNTKHVFPLRLLSETNDNTLDVDVVLHLVEGVMIRRAAGGDRVGGGEILSSFSPHSIRRAVVLTKLTPARLRLSLVVNTNPNTKSEQDLILIPRSVGNDNGVAMLSFVSEKIGELYLRASGVVNDYLGASVESAGMQYTLSPERYEKEQASNAKMRDECMSLLKKAEEKRIDAEKVTDESPCLLVTSQIKID